MNHLVGKLPGGATELVELPPVGEDDQRDLSIAENRQLIGFLQQPISAFGECHLPVNLVLDPLQLHPSPTHDPSPLKTDISNH